MARVVIVDAGPLIALAAVDRLALLQGLFTALHITPSVRDECLGKPGRDADRIRDAIAAGWLAITRDKGDSPLLSPALGQGESDSIRLAMQAPRDSLLILDDRLARRHAQAKGLQFIGTVRVLDLAEQRGLAGSAETIIREMSASGYRISIDLPAHIRSQ